MSAERPAVLAWLSGLVDLTRAPADDRPSATKLRLYDQMLDDFPLAAFTPASLQAVTERMEFFPAIGPLRERLGEWWQANRPPQTLIAGPAGAERPWVRRSGETTERYMARRGFHAEIRDGYEVVVEEPQP